MTTLESVHLHRPSVDIIMRRRIMILEGTGWKVLWGKGACREPREKGSHGIKDWQRDESEASDLYYGLSRFDYTAAITVLPWIPGYCGWKWPGRFSCPRLTLEYCINEDGVRSQSDDDTSSLFLCAVPPPEVFGRCWGYVLQRCIGYSV